jgi:hypothetical protein
MDCPWAFGCCASPWAACISTASGTAGGLPLSAMSGVAVDVGVGVSGDAGSPILDTVVSRGVGHSSFPQSSYQSHLSAGNSQLPTSAPVGNSFGVASGECMR